MRDGLYNLELVRIYRMVVGLRMVKDTYGNMRCNLQHN